MKRTFCMLLALLMIFSLGAQSFADDVLYCRICGRQIPVDSNVCPYCGTAVIHMDDSGSATPRTDAPAAPAASPAAATDAPFAAGPFKSGVRKSGSLRVTKSPTSESVPYGGSCIFIAHADNASSITWYLANTDATTIAEAGEAASCASGLYVSGNKTDTLSLSGIPSWMNGYQVQACFTGADGTVYTEVAKIWTYAPEPERRCNYWDYWDYWYRDPWFWDYYWNDYYGPGAPDIDHPIAQFDDGSSIVPSLPYHGPSAIVIHTDHDVRDGDEDPLPPVGGDQPGPAPGPGPGPAPDDFVPGPPSPRHDLTDPGPAPAGFDPAAAYEGSFELDPDLEQE